MKDAFFIAAPLFTAAALSLAGVVAGADTEFLLPGFTLLLLVASSLVLIASIQLNYHGRQFAFTVKDVEERLGHVPAWQRMEPSVRSREFARLQRVARKRYRRFARYSAHCFNVGVLLLGLGVAGALAPPDTGKQLVWRWIACGMVFVATALEGVWIGFLVFKRTSEEEN
jgi:predicted membrane protein